MTRSLTTPLIGLVACAAVTVAAGARAEETAAEKARADLRATVNAAKAPAPRAAGAKKVIRLDTLTVEGRIQKPEAFYVLPRSNLSFDELQKTESFVPKIEKSAQKDPF